MDWKDVGHAVADAAPIIGTLLGGPAGAAVGGLVAATLGTKSNPDDVSATIAANPDTLLKIKQMELDQQAKLQALAIQAEQNRLSAQSQDFATEVSDRQSARELAAKQPHDWLRPMIAVLLVSAVIGIVVAVFLPSSKAVLADQVAMSILSMVIGMVFRDFGMVMSYLFGTSRDAQQMSQDVTKFATTPGDVSFYDATKGSK